MHRPLLAYACFTKTRVQINNAINPNIIIEGGQLAVAVMKQDVRRFYARASGARGDAGANYRPLTLPVCTQLDIRTSSNPGR
jgi:hypothetical protein